MTELKDWLNSINQTKKHLIDEDPSLEKEYPPYIINRCFSGHLDTLMFTNEMNKYNLYFNNVKNNNKKYPFFTILNTDDMYYYV